jgi:hypothetical protein
MSKLFSCPLPSNINPLSPNGYKFSIQRIPGFTYFCQEVNLPSVTLGVSQVATPFVNYSVPGDQMEFGDLSVQFLIDSGMNNYKALFNWLRGLGFPESYGQYKEQASSDLLYKSEVASTVSDATLTILGPNNTDVQSIIFRDCQPVSIDSLQFLSNSQDVQYLIGNATFRYSYYDFI